MAHIVKITDRNGTYQIDCNDWNGPNAPLSDTWTTLKLTGVSRCPALPKRFISPITIDYNSVPKSVNQLETVLQTTNTVTLRWQ